MNNKYLGWIGIDIGTWAVRLAQVEKADSGWHIAARHVYTWPRPLDVPALREGRTEQLEEHLEGFKADYRRRRSIFRGRQVAVSLPAELVPLRQMQMPNAEADELRAMVAQELSEEARDAEDVPFGFWVSTAPNGEGLINVTAVVSPEKVTYAVAKAMQSCGLEVAVVDVPACSLARASDLCRAASDQIGDSITIDLGNNSTSVVMCRDGVPLHARLVRDQGIRDCITPLADHLGIDCDEAFQLLTITGFGDQQGGKSVARDWVNDVLATPFAKLAEQLLMTVQFFLSKRSESTPIPIFVCGGGATIAGVPQWLSQRLQMTVQPWRLNRADGGTTCAVTLAPWAGATALSCLAWEPMQCT